MGKGTELHLGGIIDPDTGARTGEALEHAAASLTTHGVIVGMTGSGKTGLGVVLLEEALLAGIPTLILDPKGDMGNLLFRFPELRGEDFRPWIDEEEARRKSIAPEAFAEKIAARWSAGHEDWGIDAETRHRFAHSVRPVLYTPGSSAGVPLDLIGTLSAPDADWEEEAESLRDEIEAFVSSLLKLAGLDSDPLTSPEHILLSTLVEQSWRAGRSLDLAALVSMIPEPPIRTLGVFEVDTFIPRKDRMKLALRLNGLLASPTFRSWMQGVPLQPEALFASPDGRTPAPIIYLAHLSDEERQFVVTLLLSRLVRWIRQQPGTSELRALVYLDEVFGFAPPTAQPPSKKPIMTIFKQARAHGVGMVVATQNPVDLDYKIMSNAGTWVVGRLQTERDKLRIIEALSSATGGIDTAAWDKRIGALDKRQFLLHTTRSPVPRLFTSRWAISYLRGPLTLSEVEKLKDAADPVETPAPAVSSPGGESASRDGEPPAEPRTVAPPPVPDGFGPVAPEIAAGVPSYFLDSGAPWATEIGVKAPSERYAPGLVARVNLLFDERVADLDVTQEWEAVFFPLGDSVDPARGQSVDYDPRDLKAEGPEGALYELGTAPLDRAAFFRSAERDIKEHLYRSRRLEIFKNAKLKLYSRVGESREEFAARCVRAADDSADAQAAKLRARYETRLRAAEERAMKEEERLRELDADVGSRRRQEVVSGAEAILGMFLRGKARASGLSAAASRRSMTRRTEERRRSAEQRLARKEEEVADLEDEFGTKIQDIHAKWRASAAEIEEFEVPLEKTDIHVGELAVIWVPVA